MALKICFAALLKIGSIDPAFCCNWPDSGPGVIWNGCRGILWSSFQNQNMFATWIRIAWRQGKRFYIVFHDIMHFSIWLLVLAAQAHLQKVFQLARSPLLLSLSYYSNYFPILTNLQGDSDFIYERQARNREFAWIVILNFTYVIICKYIICMNFIPNCQS